MFECRKDIAKKLYPILTFIIINSTSGLAQSLFQGKEHLFTPPHTYTVFTASDLMVMDGKATEASWLLAPWSSYFTDIEGDRKPAPDYQTRFKMLWDKQHLYLFAELEEPHLWGTLSEHDEIIYNNNDFEIFIDPDGDTHQYYEIEVNALKTIFDLYMDKPYRNGGIAHINWNANELKTEITLNGTLNKPDDKDHNWTLEMAIPFAALSMEKPARTPQHNSLWRMNFSRVQWNLDVVNYQYQRKKDNNGKLLPENNWVWSPQGVINMHFPERWGYIFFSEQSKASHSIPFSLPFSESMKHYLWLIYYKQKDYFAAHKQYAKNLELLGFPSEMIELENQLCRIIMTSREKEFKASIRSEKLDETWQITNEGLVTERK